MPDERERRVRGAKELLSGLRGARSGAVVRRPDRLDTPVDVHRSLLGRGYDPELLGRTSERVARFLGTGTFIVYMTIFVGVWLVWNSLAPRTAQFDPHGMNFTLLTLLLSLQASYAAPLILLAQNRQDDRDRVNLDADRRNDSQLRADLDFLSREVASLRLAVGEIATRDYVRSEVRQLTDTLTDLLGLDEEAQAARTDNARRVAKKAEKAEKARLERTTAAVAAAAGRATTVALAEAAERVTRAALGSDPGSIDPGSIDPGGNRSDAEGTGTTGTGTGTIDIDIGTDRDGAGRDDAQQQTETGERVGGRR